MENKCCIIKTLNDIKTTLLVIDSNEKNICDSFSKAIDKQNLNNNVNIKTKCITKHSKIKKYDIYVINTYKRNEQEINKIIKNIYKIHDKAMVYLVNENNTSNDSISQSMDSINMKKVSDGLINFENQNFNEIIKYIAYIEDTKQKLTHLCTKLESIQC